MRRGLPLLAAFCLLACGTASAKDFYITVFEGDFEALYALQPDSIVDLGEGVKRADLLSVDFDTIEMGEGMRATIGTLAVMVIEINCQSTPRQFKQNSEYVQFSRDEEPIDKTSQNPYKNWTPIPAGSGMERHAAFICAWPQVTADLSRAKVPAADTWGFVDSVVDTVRAIRAKQ